MHITLNDLVISIYTSKYTRGLHSSSSGRQCDGQMKIYFMSPQSLSSFLKQKKGVSYHSEKTSSKPLKVDHRVELPLTEILNCLWRPPTPELHHSDFIKYLARHTDTRMHGHTQAHTNTQKAISSNASRTERLSLVARGNP